MVSSRAPDSAGLGGVELHVDALMSFVPPGFSVHCAYVHAGELFVESATPRKLIAVLPLAVAARPLEPNPALADSLATAVLGLRAHALHLHSPALGPETISDVIARTGVRSVVTLHEHSLVCENYELLEGGRRYCGIPEDLRRCDDCLEKTLGRPRGAVQEWRSSVRTLVSSTDAFIVPSESVLEHASRLFPEVRTRAHRIAWGIPAPSARATVMGRARPLRVAIVGLLSTVKGRDRLAALLSAARGIEVEWHLFGATEGDSFRDLRGAAERIVVHGAYRRADLALRLVESACQVALLPSVGSEAFSLTLSEVTSAGIPALASNLGALDERVRADGLGWTFDPWDEPGFARLISRLERDRDEIDRVASRVRSRDRRTEEQMVSECAAVWAQVAALPRRAVSADTSKADARFAAAVRRAADRRPGAIGRAIERFRKSDFYRDLRLRRAVPVSVRKRLEDAALRLAARKGRP
jgi:glycosyltransferase involved in cell wall biosynthesis